MLGRSYEEAFLRFVRDILDFGSGYGNHSFRHGLEDRIREAQVAKGLWPAGLSHQYTGRKSTRPKDRDLLLVEGSEGGYGDGYSPAGMLPFIERLDFSKVQLPPPFADWLGNKKL